MGQGHAKELPFVIGEQFASLTGSNFCSIHAGRRKVGLWGRVVSRYVLLSPQFISQDGDEPVTVFVFDFSGKAEGEVRRSINKVICLCCERWLHRQSATYLSLTIHTCDIVLLYIGGIFKFIALQIYVICFPLLP